MVTILVNREVLSEVTQKVHKSFRQELGPKLNDLDHDRVLKSTNLQKAGQ